MQKCTLPVNSGAMPSGGRAEPNFASKVYMSTARRSFIGGSDARIIMGKDEGRLIRLWREKRGEVEAEDLSGDLLVQLGTVTEPLNRHWYKKNTGHVVVDVQCQVFHAVHRWMAATLDGRLEATGAVFEAKFMLPWNFSEESAAEKHMAQLQHNMWVTAFPDRGAVDHHRRRQMGGNDDSGRSALPAPLADGRAKILALCPERRAPAPVRPGAAQATARSHPRGGYERLEQLGGIGRHLSPNPRGP